MTCLRKFVLRCGAIAAAMMLACPLIAAQTPEDPSSKVIEVYLFTVRTVVLPGLTSATVLDPEIAGLGRTGDNLRLTGIQRGETLVVAHIDGKPVSIIVRVVLRPETEAQPSLGGKQIERGVGTFSSDMQVARTGGRTNAVVLDNVFWRQQVGDRQLGMSLQTDHSTLAGQHGFNLRSGNIDYRTPHFELNALDFNVNLTGATVLDRIPTFSITDTVQLRGAGLTILRGKNQWSAYAGVTVPYYFLSLASSRDVAGVSFRRQVNDKLVLFNALTFLRIPVTGSSTRQISVMQQGGFRYAPSRQLSLDGIGGVSNSGEMVRAHANYTASRFSAFASTLYSSPRYPLNQLQSLFAGTSSVRAGISSQWNQRVGGSFYYEHSTTGSGLLLLRPASSDYFSPSLTLNVTRNEAATLGYTRSFSTGGFQAAGQGGSRFDFSLRSTFRERIMNSVQVLAGSIQDPLQINSESRFNFNDTLSFRMRAASLQVSLSHSRTNPSLAQKLNQELALLSPQLQQLFLQNPSAFVVSDLPPEIRALLESQQPISTSVSVAAQLPLTRRLSFNPNLSLTRDTLGTRQGGWASFFGYGLLYQVSPTLQLRSSLSSVWMTNSSQTSLQRTTVFSVGLVKSFNGSPAHFLARRSRHVIQGRVYRDDNINGAFNKSEPGLAGVQVQLDDAATSVTDEQGIYRFPGVTGGVHRVSLNLAQFSDPVRMTTRGESEINLDARAVTSTDFGIINFARLMGSVFNDLRFQGKPQPDSVGLGNAQLLLRRGEETVATIPVPPNGHFEEDNIAPGDYELTVDTNTIPANYMASVTAIPVHIAPVSTVVVNIPVRAMRSISGHVFLKVAPDDKLLPLAGVQLSAGGSLATTAADGAFILRNLPAGDLTVGLIPIKALAEGLKLPSGGVHMPAEPVQIQNATIVLSNPELVPYLVSNHTP